MSEHVCLIYILFNRNGAVDYVGRTSRSNMKRISEHKHVLGYLPKYEIVARCSINCRLVEKMWIDFYRESGYALRNVDYGQGPHKSSEITRLKIYLKNRNRPNTWGQKISATSRAKNPDRVSEPRKRIHITRRPTKTATLWESLSSEKQQEVLNKIADDEKILSVEDRKKRKSERASESQKKRWAAYTPERRDEVRKVMAISKKNHPDAKRLNLEAKSRLIPWSEWSDGDKLARNKKISDTLKSNPESCRRRGLKGLGKVMEKYPDHMESMNKGVHKFWQELRADPAKYKKYVDGRSAVSSKTKKEAFAIKPAAKSDKCKRGHEWSGKRKNGNGYCAACGKIAKDKRRRESVR